MNDIVIVGGGHAAAQLCASLAEAGLGPRVHLVCEEAVLPYQRPPLSKAYLKKPDETLQPHRAEDWYREAGIQLHRADPAVAIDRAEKMLTLRSHRVLGYDTLVLATGARARALPGLPKDLANVVTLRNAADASRLRALLDAHESVTVIGGGFIGLEVAATARGLGKTVRVLEVAPRLLGRVVSPELGAFVLEAHRASGIDVRLGVRLGAYETEGDRLVALEVDGAREPVDLLLSAVGAVPETSLAQAAGLPCDDGVIVDAYLRSIDPSVFALGDCARYPLADTIETASPRLLRLESVQNATEHARALASTLAGQPRAYASVPWFWSDQGALRLQMTGLLPLPDTPALRSVRRPGPAAGGFSLLHYVGDRLCCIESVNAPMDQMMGRKLIEAGRHPAPEVAADPAVALKTHLG